MRPHPVLAPSVIVAAVFLAASAAHAAAQPRVVFPAEQLTRGSGAPDVFSRTFTVPSYVVGPYTLTIMNGQPNGTGRGAIAAAVAAGRVLLNGTEVVAPAEFSRTVARIDKIVALT